MSRSLSSNIELYDYRRSTSATEPKYRCAGRRYKPIEIEQPTGITLFSALSELRCYETQFLDKVESNVSYLIRNSGKRDCTAIVACNLSTGTRIEYRVLEGGFGRRFKAMLKYEGPAGTLSKFDGEELDSWLSGPIIEMVQDLYAEFLKEHGPGRWQIRYLVERLRSNPTTYRAFAQQFAQSTLNLVQPFTKEMVKALAHLVYQQLSLRRFTIGSANSGQGEEGSNGCAKSSKQTVELSSSTISTLGTRTNEDENE